MLADVIMHAIRSGGYTLDFVMEIPDEQDDAKENGGKKYVITAVNQKTGERHVVRGPFMTQTLVAMAHRLGLKYEYEK